MVSAGSLASPRLGGPSGPSRGGWGTPKVCPLTTYLCQLPDEPDTVRSTCFLLVDVTPLTRNPRGQFFVESRVS